MIAYGSGRSGRIHRNIQTAYEPTPPEPTKACTACGRKLPVSEFWTIKTKDGRRPKCWCKVCERDRKGLARERRKA